MKKISLILLLSLPAISLFADSTTTRIGLTKPTIGSTGWGTKLNSDMDLIDSTVACVGLPNTYTSSNTFNGLLTSTNTTINGTLTLNGPMASPLTVPNGGTGQSSLANVSVASSSYASSAGTSLTSSSSTYATGAGSAPYPFTFSSTVTYNGSEIRGSNWLVLSSTYPGTNLGDKITNAINAMPDGSVIDATALGGNQAMNDFVSPAKRVTVLLGVSTITLTGTLGGNFMVVRAGNRFIGKGPNMTVFKIGTVAGGTSNSSIWFDADADYSELSNFTLDGGTASTAVQYGIGMAGGQDRVKLSNFEINNASATICNVYISSGTYDTVENFHIKAVTNTLNHGVRIFNASQFDNHHTIRNGVVEEGGFAFSNVNGGYNDWVNLWAIATTTRSAEGFNMDSAYKNTFTNIHSIGRGDGGYVETYNEAVAGSPVCSENKMNGGYFENMYLEGMHITCNKCDFENIFVYNTAQNDALNRSGIIFDAATSSTTLKNATVIDDQADTTHYDGIQMSAGSNHNTIIGAWIKGVEHLEYNDGGTSNNFSGFSGSNLDFTTFGTGTNYSVLFSTSASAPPSLAVTNAGNVVSSGSITAAGGFVGSFTTTLTGSKAVVSSATGALAESAVSTTTLSYLDATSSVQTQINTKSPSASPTFSGTVTITTMTTANAAINITTHSVVTGDMSINGNTTIGDAVTDTFSVKVTTVTINNTSAGLVFSTGTGNILSLNGTNGNVLFGNTSSVGTLSPLNVSFGSTYGTNTPGQGGNIKWTMYPGYGIGMSANLMEFQVAPSSNFGFFSNGVQSMRINGTTANVEIGTQTVPMARLDINGTTGGSTNLQRWASVNNSTLSYVEATGALHILSTGTAYALSVSTSSTELPVSLGVLNAGTIYLGNLADGYLSVASGVVSSSSGISASTLTGSHTLPDGVLSTNVPLLNAASQNFTGNMGFNSVPFTRLANSNTNYSVDSIGVGANSILWRANEAGYVASFVQDNTATNAAGVSINVASSAGTSAPDQTAALWVGSADTLRFMVQRNGNVSIGVSSATAQLHTTDTVRFAKFGAGAATFDASGNISSVSDERLKNIQGPFNRGLSDILKINPISYKWKPASGMETKSTYHGFSAQNIKAAMPEIVFKAKSGYYSFEDRAMIATLVNAVKELNAEVEDLKKKIKG